MLTRILQFAMPQRMAMVTLKKKFARKLTPALDEIVRLLLEKGADPAAEDNFPLRWAAHNGHAVIVEMLLKTGKVDVRSQNGYSLKWAKLNGHDQVVKLITEQEKNSK